MDKVLYMALTLQKHLQSLLKEAQKQPSLHDFRVSIRRALVWLKVGQKNGALKARKRDQKRLKKLVKMTNALRDLEVSIALCRQQGGALNLVRKLSREQKKAEEKIQVSFAKAASKVPEIEYDRAQSEMPLTELPWLAPTLIENAERLDHAMRQIKSQADQSAIHRARLIAKTLRYLLEPLSDALLDKGSILKKLRRLQDLCGGLRDADLLLQRIATEKKGESPEVLRVTKGLQQEIKGIMIELGKTFLTPSRRKNGFAVDLDAALWSNKEP